MKPIRLTFAERWILSNQYEILERLYPKKSEYYEATRKAIERGFTAEYTNWLLEDELPVSECEKVWDVLGMYKFLYVSYAKLDDTSGIDPESIEFPGFDGRTEEQYLEYCRWICESGRGSFAELYRDWHYNSYGPMMAQYEKQLTRFDEVREASARSGHEWLRKEDIQYLVRGVARPSRPGP